MCCHTKFVTRCVNIFVGLSLENSSINIDRYSVSLYQILISSNINGRVSISSNVCIKLVHISKIKLIQLKSDECQKESQFKTVKSY